MLKEFKQGDKITPKHTFTRPFTAHYARKATFKAGVEYTVSGLMGNLFAHGEDMYETCIYDPNFYDITALFTIIPQETDTQRKARELREQAQIMLDKATDLEATI